MVNGSSRESASIDRSYFWFGPSESRVWSSNNYLTVPSESYRLAGTFTTWPNVDLLFARQTVHMLKPKGHLSVRPSLRLSFHNSDSRLTANGRITSFITSLTLVKCIFVLLGFC